MSKMVGMALKTSRRPDEKRPRDPW